MLRSSFKTLSAKAAAQLDQELMSTGAFSIDQLMELAGLSVAQAIYKQYPPKKSCNNTVLVLVGPGNNGGDGLVAARHLKLWGGYDPILYYPKRTKNQLYSNLVTQLHDLDVNELESVEDVKRLVSVPQAGVDLIIDSLFGFSFKPPIRAPFDELIRYLAENHDKIAPIVSVDIPSGWDVDKGPTDLDINATMLVSLTAPKPCAARFVDSSAEKIHYLGGRFINPKIAKKYDIEELVDLYEGNELIVKFV
ncbi:YjeF N-terminal domain-containing protein [Scheffersomyces xylosifermentans]|uniref:YjeF N-terminal domain-containing protein n=1 Tax=Scheffersomyces xylosifermentans TaxID=1304137 RepID=UPI00315DCC0B